MEEVEVPQYFLCPISLQIMKDPVTAITGITYDRESIQRWLRTSKGSPSCPVTNQPLPKGSDLTPNHTLLRLIQSWITTASTNGIQRTPSPIPPLDDSFVRSLINDLEVCRSTRSLKKIESLMAENQRNRTCMGEAGLAKAILCFMVRCWEERRTAGLEEALKIFHFMWDDSLEEIKLLVKDNNQFIDSLTWVLSCDNNVDGTDFAIVKTKAISVLNNAVKVVSPFILENFRVDFFKAAIKVLKQKLSTQASKSALHVLIESCPWGQNRTKIVEANAVFELIELELEKPTDKKITELIVELLAQLCSVADGRARFLIHAGSVAMLSKRILRVSPATDDRAVNIFGLISRYSASREVLLEMLRVGAVSKLCMLIQADCAMYLKEKVRGILKLHSNVWNNSPCIAVYLLTMYPR